MVEGAPRLGRAGQKRSGAVGGRASGWHAPVGTRGLGCGTEGAGGPGSGRPGPIPGSGQSVVEASEPEFKLRTRTRPKPPTADKQLHPTRYSATAPLVIRVIPWHLQDIKYHDVGISLRLVTQTETRMQQ